MNPIAFYMNYLIEDCYKEDYDPQYAESYYDNYFFEYTFIEWYFLYRKRFNLQIKYKHTPNKLIIGYEKI